jgi:site-specific recombinase XerD
MCAAPRAGRPAFSHPIGGRELRALRRLQREGQPGSYVFVSERLAPLSVAGYQRMVARAGEAAGFPFQISSHVLRHSCGYKVGNDGRDTRSIQHYLGHRSIGSTVRYTALAPDRFQGFLERLTLEAPDA